MASRTPGKPAARRPRTKAPDPDRFPSGRRRTPLGVREGGAVFEQIHTELARQALRLLAELGYAGMGMDQVATAAGVGVATVYRHYSTKVELAVAAIEQLPTGEGWTDGDDAVVDRIERAMAIGAAHHEYFVPVLANAIVFRATVPELLEALTAHVLVPRQQVIRDLVETAQFRGEIRDGFDPTLVASMLTGELIDNFLGVRPLAKGKARGREAVARTWPLLRP